MRPIRWLVLDVSHNINDKSSKHLNDKFTLKANKAPRELIKFFWYVLQEFPETCSFNLTIALLTTFSCRYSKCIFAALVSETANTKIELA